VSRLRFRPTGEPIARDEFQRGEAAPQARPYEQLNVVGTPTGREIIVMHGDTFPAVPRGFTRRRLSSLSAAELRARATQYRQMAATASTALVMQELLKLAERFDAFADRQETSP
jgi:hypothetical protein